MKCLLFLPHFSGALTQAKASASKARISTSGGAQKVFAVVAESFWEETEKQKIRNCRAQELARSSAQENEWQKKGGLLGSVQSTWSLTHVNV
jgi:hypothetical protein